MRGARHDQFTMLACDDYDRFYDCARDKRPQRRSEQNEKDKKLRKSEKKVEQSRNRQEVVKKSVTNK